MTAAPERPKAQEEAYPVPQGPGWVYGARVFLRQLEMEIRHLRELHRGDPELDHLLRFHRPTPTELARLIEVGTPGAEKKAHGIALRLCRSLDEWTRLDPEAPYLLRPNERACPSDRAGRARGALLWSAWQAMRRAGLRGRP